MDVLLLSKITISTLIVLLSGESRQTIFIDVQSQWIYRGHSDIDSEIELVTINKQWFAHIFTDNHLCSFRNLIDVLRNENAFTLRRGRWFTNPGHFWFFCH